MSQRVEVILRECFNDAQRSFACHKRVLEQLSSAFEQDPILFWTDFIGLLDRVLVIYNNTPAAERIVHLVASFAISHSTAVTETDGSQPPPGDEDRPPRRASKQRSTRSRQARTSKGRRGKADTGANNFCSALLAYLLQRSKTRSKAVRYRSCQLISSILTSLPDHAEISERLYEPLLKTLLLRARDKVPKVRMSTVSGLGRLQEGDEDESDDDEDSNSSDLKDRSVRKELLRLMCHDSSPSVRKAAMSFTSIATTAAVGPGRHGGAAGVDALISRCRDVREDVRKSAFRLVADRVDPQLLSVETRVNLLRSGLLDRAKAVRTACTEKLLREGWFRAAFQGDVIALVASLDPAENLDVCLLAVRLLVTKTDAEEVYRGPDATKTRIDVEHLTPASVLVLRVCCELSTDVCELAFESSLLYATTLERYGEALSLAPRDDKKAEAEGQFVVGQLLAIVDLLDHSEESGRCALETVLTSRVMPKVAPSSGNAKRVVRALRRVSTPSVLEQSILDRIHSDFPSADAGGDDDDDDDDDDSDHDDGREDESIAAARLRARLRVQELIEALLLGRGEIANKDLVRSVIFRGFTSAEPDLRAISLQCLSLLCLQAKSDQEAVRFLPLYTQVCENDSSELRLLALKSLVDFALTFALNKPATSHREGDEGSDAAQRSKPSLAKAGRKHTAEVEDDDNDDDNDDDGDDGDDNVEDEHGEVGDVVPTSPKAVIESLVLEALFHSDGDMRTTAAEGCAKLIFCRRLAPEPALLSKLLLLLFNPVTEEDGRLRQSLSVFFRAFSLLSYANRSAFERALMPTLQTILDAPDTSPIRTIDPVSMTMFIFYLTETTDAKPNLTPESGALNQTSIAERMVLQLLHHVIDLCEQSGTSDELREFCRVLGSVKLRLDSGAWRELDLIRSLTIKAVGYLRSMDDRRCMAALRQFSSQVLRLERDDENNPRKEEAEDEGGSEEDVGAKEVIALHDDDSSSSASSSEEGDGSLSPGSMAAIDRRKRGLETRGARGRALAEMDANVVSGVRRSARLHSVR